MVFCVPRRLCPPGVFHKQTKEIAMEKYTILRDISRKSSRRSASRSAPPGADFNFEARGVESAAGDVLPAPEIETTTLSDRDVQDAVNDPDVAGVARVMPT